MAGFTLKDEQIVWTDKSSGRTNRLDGQIVWTDKSSGRTNRLDGQIVWTNKSSGRTNRLDGQIVWTDKSSGRTNRLDGQIVWTDKSSGRTNRLDEQIVWTDKSSDGLVDYCEFKSANCSNFQVNFPQTIAPFACSIPPRRANLPFVRLNPSECEFRRTVWSTCSSGRTNRLQNVVFTDGQTNGQILTTKSSENLFVPFSHQPICPSETICPSRRFVRLLV